MGIDPDASRLGVCQTTLQRSSWSSGAGLRCGAAWRPDVGAMQSTQAARTTNGVRRCFAILMVFDCYASSSHPRENSSAARTRAIVAADTDPTNRPSPARGMVTT